ERIFYRGDGPGSGAGGQGGDRTAGKGGGGGQENQSPAYIVCGRDLLSSGDGRGELQPRPLRRGQIRLPDKAGRKSDGDVHENPFGGVRSGSQTPHHARNLCAVGGVL